MEISPRYDGPAIVQLDGDPVDVREPLVRQRVRLEEVLRDLSDEQWRTPSRCEGWTAQDVIAHLVTTNQFWSLSIEAGVKGEPTRFLVGFDPKATPAQLVDAGRGASPADTLAAFEESNRALVERAMSLAPEQWSAIAEAPPGHVTVSALCHHALWDAWVHERDILLPLGLAPEEHADEVAACLRYVAALGAGFAVSNGATGDGALVVDGTDPSVHVVVSVEDDVVRVTDGGHPEGALHLEGASVHLVEALSIRAPLHHDVPADRAWLLAGLADVFETTA